MFRKHATESKAKSAEIPQVSKLHNLPSSESFQALEVQVTGQEETLKVEYFAKYGLIFFSLLFYLLILSFFILFRCFFISMFNIYLGEEGHELAYIRGRKKGNNNLPPFAWTVAQKLSEAVAKTEGEIGSKYTNMGAEGMMWRLTLNYYTVSKQKGLFIYLFLLFLLLFLISFFWFSFSILGKRAGFPFHTDIPANGDETYIVGFGTPAKMEFIRHAENEKFETRAENEKSPGEVENIRDEKIPANFKNGENEKSPGEFEDVVTVEVQAGELIGLTGEVRREWLHRVVPEEESVNDRVSMVLGCRPT